MLVESAWGKDPAAGDEPAETVSSAAAAEAAPPEAANGAATAIAIDQATELFASIDVNGAPRGAFLVARLPDGDFAVRTADLTAIGIEHIAGQTVTLNDEDHVLLRSLAGANFEFDERRVHITIRIEPASLRGQVIDVRKRSAPFPVEYPRDRSAFLNYSYSHEDSLATYDTLSAEIGIRSGNFLLLSDGFYEKQGDTDRAVRLRTSLTHDNRDTLQQTVAGDVVGTSGALGRTLNLGGISFSKNFRIDPYVIRYPFASFSGVTGTPSRYEAFVNGNRVGSGSLEPGPFEVTNIQGPYGVSNVELLVRDAFGEAQYYAVPFYFTREALREGLSEYSFALGKQRLQFGIESNDYGPMAATGFYRYGVSDLLSLGGRAEASEDVFNFGPNVSLLAGRWGLFNATLSYSNQAGENGYAGVFDYSILTPKFNASVYLLAQSEQYTRIATDPYFNTELEAASTLSFGPVTFSYTTSQPYNDNRRSSYGVSVTPRLPDPRMSLYTSLRHFEGVDSRTEFFIGINYYFRKDYSVSSSVQMVDGGHSVTGSVQKAIPVGEGWGFSAAASQFENTQGSGHSVRPFVQYNAKYATILADYQSVTVAGETLESKRVAVQGSITSVGGDVMLGRPVTDAFAVVKVDDLENVRVYQAGQLAGTTDREGRLLIPSLGSYVHNQISVDNRDVPMTFELDRFTRLISPGLRGGAVLDFDAKRIQAVFGTLKIRRNGEATPLRYGEIALVIEGQRTDLPVGETGEFFIENLSPATYTLSYTGTSGPCTVTLEVPVSEEPIIEVGELLCVPQ